MKEKENKTEFNELRGNAEPFEKIEFKRNIIGGCSVKEVYEYIEYVNDRLYNAEITFKNQLDEFSTMVSMLTKERDKIEAKMKEAEEKVKAREKMLADAESANMSLSQSNASLKTKMEELSNDLNKKKNVVSPEIHMKVVRENEMLREQYKAAISEKETIIAEKNEVLEKSRATTENLKKLFDKNNELWNKNINQSLEIRKLISMVESKSHEVSHNHMQNIDKIRTNIQNILDLLDDDSSNITMLIRSPYEFTEEEHNDDGAQQGIPAACSIAANE